MRETLKVGQKHNLKISAKFETKRNECIYPTIDVIIKLPFSKNHLNVRFFFKKKQTKVFFTFFTSAFLFSLSPSSE